MAEAASPTARALLALELLQGSPGITAERLADKLGVSERAARRYVAVLREAGIPVESVDWERAREARWAALREAGEDGAGGEDAAGPLR